MIRHKFLIIGAFFLTFFLSSCAGTTVENIAYVTVYNEGDLAALATVDGTEKTLSSGTYATWEIDLGSSSSTSLELYAELVDDSRYNVSESITIDTGEVYLWPIGWYSDDE